MPVRGDFYYFVPTFLRQEFESCVQKKGMTAMQVVAVESDILRASRQSPSMPSVIPGLHRRSQNWCCSLEYFSSVLLDRKSS